MNGKLRKIALLISFLCISVPAAVAADAALPMDSKAVLGYLDRMIDWRHRAISAEAPYSLPQEALFRTSLQVHTAKTLRAGFDFARALAAVIDETAKPETPKEQVPPADSRQRGIGQAIARVQDHISQLQGEAAKASKSGDRKSIEGQIRLEQEHLSLLRTIAVTVGAADEDSQTLSEKIQQLSSAVPGGDGDQAKSTAEAVMAASTVPQAPSGIAGLAGRIYGLMRERAALRTIQDETQKIYDENRKYSQAVREAVQDIMKKGDALRAESAAPAAAHPGQPAPAPPLITEPTFDSLLAQMKEYSAVAVALSRVNMSLRTCNSDLGDWTDLISQRIQDLVRILTWRAGILLVLIAAIFGLSGLASRATKRYVLDDRRRTLLRSVRRGVLGLTIAVTVFISFFTDFGSLATFAGLLTAGLAVSLQTVILSSIAYFNFFGPFGIRLGDRVTVAGVTGKVIQITPLRFNMMELRDSDLGYLPSGRVVGFANSILFQPTPFFRQTTGTNFVWSEVTLTLDKSVDYEETFKKLSAVVQRVYARHGDTIKKQEAAFQTLTRFKAEVSVPQMYLKITGTGVIMVIRYAVQREHEKEMNIEMTQELLMAIRHDPQLKFVNIS